MLHPRHWLNHRRTKRALVGYPLYDVPHKQAEEELCEEYVEDNYEYFLRVRLERLTYFRSWLQRHFGVVAAVDGDGLRAVDAWIHRFGGALIGDEFTTMRIFSEYSPRWVDGYAGYNVIYDIAIFIGEYLIYKRPRLHWELYRGPKAGSGETSGSNMFRPHVGGFPRYWGEDALNTAYFNVAASRDCSLISQHKFYRKPNSIVRSCQECLVLANVPDDGKPFVFGDYSNEPL